ncbi:sensor histidine kinase [Maribacter sp. MAR_2009_72]|uniref:sensor histidine kinase n=1 Tax=Maribacter sp. MAR_2009_72 TaxID=1250050 RepID=UPI00119C65B4|nr:histidine kinase [Maribacter sp. MAR_2009_72]TVZ14335.1 histidine kinase [Maribacter sp. MAR_2009_72]
MIQKFLKNTILINLGAFLLVLLLELFSNLIIKDKLGSDYALFIHSLSYTVHIMGIIWVNHFILIPYFLDKKRYLLFSILFVATIFVAISTKGNFSYDWITISKFFFFFLYTTGTGMAVFFLRRNIRIERENSEKEKLQRELELNYLKEQVNPHFLFNSLNSIYALSRQQSKETPEVVMQLSELMRYQLESAKKDFVSLKEELEFIENYLLLEEKRLSKRCTIEFLIEGELLNYKIAPMLLIPFVENAIKHGAQATNEQSTIDVYVAIKNAKLHVNVVNSKHTAVVKSTRTGMGLENVKRRLNLLYSDAHILEINEMEKEYHVNLTIDITD